MARPKRALVTSLFRDCSSYTCYNCTYHILVGAWPMQMEKMADRTYRNVLERYPKAVKLLRSYALFLETVKSDSFTAAKYNAEADKQEEMQDSMGDEGGGDTIDQRSAAVITINAMGVIQTTNKVRVQIQSYASCWDAGTCSFQSSSRHHAGSAAIDLVGVCRQASYQAG